MKDKEKEEKHDKIALLGKDELHTIEVLTSKSLIDSYISHDELVSVNNVFREYNEMKKEINPETSAEYTYKNGWYKQKNLKEMV